MKGGSEWAVPTEGGPRKISRGKVTSSGPQCTIRYHPGLPAGLIAYGSQRTHVCTAFLPPGIC